MSKEIHSCRRETGKVVKFKITNRKLTFVWYFALTSRFTTFLYSQVITSRKEEVKGGEEGKIRFWQNVLPFHPPPLSK